MYRYCLLFLSLFLLSCEEEPGGITTPVDNFDRSAMLEYWADGIIVPRFETFATAATDLHAAATRYAATPTATELAALRATYVAAYLSWQRLSPFMTGPGEELRLREQLNVYPTNAARIEAERDAAPNLELPANLDIQGFPALDYLLYGASDPAAATDYLLQLTERMETLATLARDRWRDGYRDEFVAASGNSATASVDRTVNDFLFYYERFLRAGKVGIPAGVFADRPLADRAEAPYHGGLSRQLFLAALDNARGFFRGSFADGTPAGESLEDYLDALAITRNGEPLSRRIDLAFADARARAEDLNADFATQVTTDNTGMLLLYDALQQNVILLKIDMLQALGINVDFVDADGD